MTAIPAARVRPATPDDAPALPLIERSAGALFCALPDLAWLADSDGTSLARHCELIGQGTVWVAVDRGDAPVAFLEAEVFGDELHVWEMSVHRDWQSRGLGRSLLAAAIGHSVRAGLATLTLTTFRDVPWNGPFYARMGFAPIAGAALSERLRRVLADEAAAGLPVMRRWAMQRALAPRG